MSIFFSLFGVAALFAALVICRVTTYGWQMPFTKRSIKPSAVAFDRQSVALAYARTFIERSCDDLNPESDTSGVNAGKIALQRIADILEGKTNAT